MRSTDVLPRHVLEPMAAEAVREAVRRKRSVQSGNKYLEDPVAFARDILRADDIAPYQSETLGRLVQERRVCVRGPHGLGKTAIAAWAVIWFGCIYPEDTKIPTTASAWRQLTKYLWPEIHKWHRRADWDAWLKMGGQIPELLMLDLRVGDGCQAFALASDNPELIEGAHAKHLLYVFDEAKTIPPETWDTAEGAFATGDAYWLAISTPGPKAGRFYDIHRRAPGYEDWWARHVTLTEAVAAGRIREDWAEARRKQWGEGSPVYQARVLGEFPEQSEDQLISLAWIEAARERDLSKSLKTEEGQKWEPICGVDIARLGDDDSSLISRTGPVVLDGETWHGNDLMQSAGRVKAKGIKANVDEIGVGAGVVDRLREQDFPVTGINVADAASDGEHFENLRAEAYWGLRERFRDGDIDLIKLPADIYDRLCGELTAIKFMYTSKGKLRIEPKADMKKRLGHSPDVADALMLAFARGFGGFSLA